HIDLKGDTQLGDVNIPLGDLLGHLNGKKEISTDDLTKLFQLNETAIKGGLGKTFNVDGGKYLFGLKDGNIQLGGANLQTGGLLGQQKGNIELGNSGKIQSLEIKGPHEIKGGSEQSSEENKEDGKYHIDLKGDTQLGDVNITLGDLLGHLNGNKEISTDDLTKLFQLNETAGGLGKTFNVEGGKYQIGLKNGKLQLGDTNLQLGGLFGNKNGKINFGNSGETRTFEIKGQPEIKGGFGKTSEETEESKGGGQLNLGFGRGNQEKQGKVGINSQGRIKDSSEEDEGHLHSRGKSGNGQGSNEEQGKIDIRIKGGMKGSFKEDHSKENKGHPQSGGKSGNGQGSDEEQGKINIRIKGGQKGSIEE
ncbi:hypothetical protein AB205_0213110, partial [Aquarana catesbeiana]